MCSRKTVMKNNSYSYGLQEERILYYRGYHITFTFNILEGDSIIFMYHNNYLKIRM